ncbi:MAG: hypothetical protein COS49_02215 [Candidatus Portnoybacteria bacterium CG03_land_8_20_14_0_80_41_10]|uniref:Four helix bundle protein n=1 Tax=Candidatus Portnoybacteria bacterium CG03_land_8_20_14_0_80_41_10 TaxID=1974808 RepID=A0A2M7BU79_9BACT|nr:MAG: hypothetical protein COS49_02215 [Candidatus Portnoybacteria bacterium CG03_land_8_20_14_0_80_41_10]
MEYKQYRVRTPVKSFRDLEVYRQTILLSSEIFKFIPEIKRAKKDRCLLDEFEILYSLSKLIPKLIAESYGDRFSSNEMAFGKLEQAMRVIANIVAKIDFITATIGNSEIKEKLNKVLFKYQGQRVKINNLRRAWLRVYQERGGFQKREK